MRYKVRTFSGAEYLTQAPEPNTAIQNPKRWQDACVTFVDERSGNTVNMAATALESVEAMGDTETQVMPAVGDESGKCTVPGIHKANTCDGWHWQNGEKVKLWGGHGRTFVPVTPGR